MRSGRRAARAVVAGGAVVLAAAASPTLAAGQAARTALLGDRIESAGAAEVSFRFETHEDVRRCGDGWSSGRWRSDDHRCWSGPAEVTLSLRDGAVRDLDVEIVRADAPVPRNAMDLGQVHPEEAANYLMSLVGDASSSVGEDAIGAAVMADGVTLWPQLLEFARDLKLDGEVRQSATFWLGQATADEAVAGLRGIVDDDPDTEVRESAVFALSQRDTDEAVPILMEIAEDSDNADVRRSAFFWLAQHKDPRVLDFFERVLKGSS